MAREVIEFGAVMLRTLIIAFTTYVMEEGADPWGGPMVFYGLAWVVLGNHLQTGETEFLIC